MHRYISAACLALICLSSIPAFGQAEKTLNGCAKQIGKETRKYIADYIKSVGAGCLDKTSTAVIENGGSAADAASSCAKSFLKLVNTDAPAKTLLAKLQAKIAKACDPSVNPDKLLHLEGDILGTGTLPVGQQIHAQDLATFCQSFGVSGPIDDLDKWTTCLTTAATCEARQSLTTQYPRLLEWLAALRPAIDALDGANTDQAIVDALAALDALDLAIDADANDVADIACGPITCSPGSEPVGSNCTPCSVGKFSPDGGTCQDCPVGTFSNTTGAAACTDCAAGRFNAMLGQTVCQQCGLGTAQPSIKQAACVPCAAGTFSSSTGATTCAPCAEGSVAASPGSTSCSPCDPGSFQASQGKSACDSCPPGAFSDTTGASSCTDCPTGRFNPMIGQTVCQQCTAGNAQPSIGQTACVPCAAGTFSSSSGAIACVPCAAGSIAASAGASSCSPCGAGTFQASQGKTSCTGCPVGTSSIGLGVTSCTPCAAGKFQVATASTACQNCGAGTYNPATGQSSCFPCSGAPSGSSTCTCTSP